MILLNKMDELESISRKDYRTFIQLLNPFAPHITEEINEICSLGDELSRSSWPLYDESKIVDDTYEMVDQVNGKIRGKVLVDSNTSRDEMLKLAYSIDNVNAFIIGKDVVKEIVIPGKLVNIVVK